MGVYKNNNGNLELISGATLWADAPIGCIQAYGGATAPDGWLICNGAAVSRTTYAALFAVIGTSFGAGDGSNTFNIPDLREATVKGAGLTGLSNNHMDADGLAVGEFLDDRIQDHRHNLQLTIAGVSGSGINVPGYTSNWPTGYVEPTSARTGATTEVKSVGVNYIIKAKQVAVPADFEGAAEAAGTAAAEEVVAQKVTKFSGTDSGNTYVTVDQLAYDQTNKTLGLKVNGADTVIPFKKGYEWKFAGTATASQTVTVTVDLDEPYIFIFKGNYLGTTNFYSVSMSLGATASRQILSLDNTSVAYSWGVGEMNYNQMALQKNGNTYTMGNPSVYGDIYYMAIPLSDVI